MNQLIDAMLSMARLTAGNCMKYRAPQRLASVIARNLSRKSRNGSLSLSPNVKIKGDATMLQIVLEICSTMPGSWRASSAIEFGVQTWTESCLFRPHDGAGFDTKYADRLFQPFTRMHAETEYPASESGLPLPIASSYATGKDVGKGNVERRNVLLFYKTSQQRIANCQRTLSPWNNPGKPVVDKAHRYCYPLTSP
jgi:light-regulated signal transduction histidine kinase (bacteriophytochrome)